MIFKKKAQRCYSCNSKIYGDFSFCPYCGSIVNQDKQIKDYGLLGKNPEIDFLHLNQPQLNLTMTDKIVGSLLNNLMKTLNKQLKNLDNESEKAEIQSFPNGIKIKIGPSIVKNKRSASFVKKPISEQQLEKMASLPRVEAKTKMRRIGDKIIYELSTPGIESPQDVFVSKLESGYEIKAIGNKKIYVNSLPVNLPIRGFAINDNKLLVEFIAKNNFY